MALAALSSANVLCVSAAGNNGSDACKYSPGSAPASLTVAASDDRDARLIFPASNSGACVGIFAPGYIIRSTYIHSTPAVPSFVYMRYLKGFLCVKLYLLIVAQWHFDGCTSRRRSGGTSVVRLTVDGDSADSRAETTSNAKRADGAAARSHAQFAAVRRRVTRILLPINCAPFFSFAKNLENEFLCAY